MRREHNINDLYEPLQYIQSVSGQYIDTGVQADDSLTMKVKFIVQYASSNYSGVCFAGNNWNTNDMIGFTVHNTGRYMKASRAGVPNINIYSYFNAGEECELELLRNNFIVRNLTRATQSNLSFTQNVITGVTRNIWICKGNTNNADMSNFTKFMFESVIFNSEVASNRRNYVPMLRKLDSKPGLLDLEGSICSLTGTPFYINAGTGEFQYA